MGHDCRTTKPVLLLCVALLTVSAAWATPWPAEVDVQDLTRAPSSYRLDQTPFSDWNVFWSTALTMPCLAYGPPVDAHTRNAEALLTMVTNAAGTSATFDRASSTKVGRLTRYYFREMRDGLPVLAGRADLVLNSRGQLMRWSLRAHDRWRTKDSHYLDLTSAASALSATLPAAKWKANESRSYAAWFPDYETHSLKPVYWVRIEGPKLHQRWEGIVDATSGEVIMNWPGIQTDVLSGAMSGPFWQPYMQSDVQTGPHPFEMAVVNGDSVYADSAGAFSREAGTNATLSTTLQGSFVAVQNGAGASGQLDTTLSAPYSPLNWNWTQNDATDAELNLYHHANVVHRWYKGLDPAFNGLDYPVPTIANYGDHYDNAFWGGHGMAFGGGFQYLNFGMFSDVIYHEYTHGVTGAIYAHVDLPYVGQSGAMNEAWSDYIACTMNGDPYVGEWIGGTFGSYFRSLLSTVVFPQDWQGEVHADSPFISAPLWTIRTQLGAEVADSLAHFARYGLATTFLDYMIAVLETDDDDGDLSNGTPHSHVIYDAFRAHGIGPGEDPVLAIHNLSYYANGQDGSQGDGDRFIEQGETAALMFHVANDAPLYPPPATNVQISVHTTDPYTTIQNGTQTVDTLRAGHSYVMAPVLLQMSATAPDHRTVIQIEVSANGGSATLHQEFEFSVGTPHVLIVMNDSTSDVERFVTSALRTSNRIYDSVEVVAGHALPASYLPERGVIVWLSGNAHGIILTPTDQSVIRSFLAGGNRIVLSGQDIVDSLGGTDFAHDVLQVQLNETSLRTVSVTAWRSPFTPNEWFLLSGGNGANNQIEETSFTPLDTNNVVARYGRTAAGQVAGVSFAQGKGLLFGFGIEAISGMASGSTNLAGFFDNIFAWASDVMDVEPIARHTGMPDAWSVGPVYPNPFNGAATISYSVLSPRGGDLKIFDLMGREVESRHLSAGSGTVEWKPQSASGVYFAQIRWSGGQTKPVKLMYLK